VKRDRFAVGCPSVAFKSFHSYSAGGRLITALSLADGRSEITDRVVDIAFECLVCGSCDVSCKICRYDMEPLNGIRELRCHLVEQDRVPDTYRDTIENHRRTRNVFGREPSTRLDWAGGLGLRTLDDGPAEVLFHPGCRYSFDAKLAHVTRSAVAVLRAANVDFAVAADEGCCGGKFYDMGYRDEFANAATYNMDNWARHGVKTIVTPCATCFWAISRLYPRVGQTVEVVHIAEYADRLVKEGRLKLTKELPMTATWHDPCHLGRQGEPYEPWDGVEKKIFGQAVVYDPPRPRYNGTKGVYDPPRDLLKAIPGVELVEMERNREAAWCCGAGGLVRETYPEFSAFTASERIAEAEATGAEAIVTACGGCERNFTGAVAASGSALKVFDIIELVEQAL
jgi:Fe-S oxidoreductase